MRFHRLPGRSRGEELSAYLDRALARPEREQFEARLSSEPETRDHLEELRIVKDLVGAMEQVAPPRAFALAPEQVDVRRRGMPPMPMAARFSFAAAAMGAAMLVVVTAAGPWASGDITSTAAPASDMAGGAESATTNAFGAEPVAGTDDGSRQSSTDTGNDAPPFSAAGDGVHPSPVPEGAGDSSKSLDEGSTRAPSMDAEPVPAAAPLASSGGRESASNEDAWRLAQLALAVTALAAMGFGAFTWRRHR